MLLWLCMCDCVMVGLVCSCVLCLWYLQFVLVVLVYFACEMRDRCLLLICCDMRVLVWGCLRVLVCVMVAVIVLFVIVVVL